MKNKTLKSRKLLVMVALIVMVALVLGMGAMTYSKYVTKSSTEAQTATAAKWGYVINLDASKLFGKNYTNTNTESSKLATVVTENGVAVKANSTTNVVAPGTTGSVTVGISGGADVKAQILFGFEIVANKNISLGTYEPIKWTLKKGETVIITPCKTSELKTKLEGLDDANKVIDAGNQADINYTLSWEWDFEETEGSENNIKDTIIGYKAANKQYSDLQTIYGGDLSGYVADEIAYNAISTELSFNLSVSVEQIQ